MQPVKLTGNYLPHGIPAARFWITLLIGVLGLSAGVQLVEASQLRGPDVALDQLLSYQLSVYAHLVLAGSTVLYLVHLRCRTRAVGLWASGLAALGACGLLAALAARAGETWVLHRTHLVPLAGVHDVMALFSASTVLIYLVLEHAYRSRSAGAFVMPVVMAAVLVESWLMAGGATALPGSFPWLHSYTVRLHVLVNLLAYGAFAVAAAVAVLYLLLARSRCQLLAAVSRDELVRIDHLNARVLQFGFVAFSAAIALGMLAAYERWGRFWSWTPKETWSLLVWCNYAAFLWMLGPGRCRGARAAWWSVAAFSVSLLCILAVNLLGGRHYG